MLYRSQLQPVAMLDVNDAVTARFVYGDLNRNVPDYMIKNGQKYRIVTDHVGSVRAVIHATSGAIVQQINYDPWGMVDMTTSTNLGFQPFGFAGGIYDPDTKLVRFGARDYDPSVGRWTAHDPILFQGGQENLYVYAGNDPVNRRDPNGLGPSGCNQDCFETCMEREDKNYRGCKEVMENLCKDGDVRDCRPFIERFCGTPQARARCFHECCPYAGC